MPWRSCRSIERALSVASSPRQSDSARKRRTSSGTTPVPSRLRPFASRSRRRRFEDVAVRQTLGRCRQRAPIDVRPNTRTRPSPASHLEALRRARGHFIDENSDGPAKRFSRCHRAWMTRIGNELELRHLARAHRAEKRGVSRSDLQAHVMPADRRDFRGDRRRGRRPNETDRRQQQRARSPGPSTR